MGSMAKYPFDVAGLELFDKEQRTKIQKVVRQVVKSANLPQALLNVTFVDADTMQEINLKWRQKDTPTDVLSFPAEMEEVLGDVVICYDVALRQAKELGHLLSEEVAVLLTHGIVHIVGLDHERSQEEARIQEECEMSILDAAGIDPRLRLTGRDFLDESK